DTGFSTGNIYVANSSGSANLRVDGAGANLMFSQYMSSADIDGDNRNDLLFGGYSYINEPDGSVWVLYSSLLESFGTSIDNIISIADSNSYSLRFDGDYLTLAGELVTGDLNDDSYDDIIVSSPESASHGYRSGSIYLVNGDPFIYSISGTLTSGGTPLAGVTVDGGSLGSVVTDAMGNYVFSNVAKHTSYTLTPTLAGYTFVPASISGVVGEDTVHNFTDSAVSTFSIMGTVVNDTVPLAGVTIYGGALGQTTTDGSGIFSFTGIAPGTTYRIYPEIDGYTFLPMEASGVLSADANLSFTVSSTEALTSPASGFWNSYLGMINILEVANRTTSGQSIQVEILDQSGGSLSVAPLYVPPLGQRDLVLNDIPGFLKDSYGTLRLTFSSSGIIGRVAFYRFAESGDNNNFSFAYTLPLGSGLKGSTYAAFNTWYPGIPLDGYSMLNWLGLANLSSLSQQFTIKTYGTDGSMLATRSVTLPGNSRLDIPAGHELAESLAGYQEIIPQNNDAKYLASVARYAVGDGSSGKTQFAFASAMLSEIVKRQGWSIISRGANADEWLEVYNTSSVGQMLAVNVYSSNGPIADESIYLPAGNGVHLHGSEYLNAGETGAVKTRFIGDTSALLVQRMSYHRDRDGVVYSASGNRITLPAAVSLFGSWNRFFDQANWLRLFNTSSTVSNVALTVYRDGLAPVSQNLSIPAYSTLDLGLHENDYQTESDNYGLYSLQAPAVVAELVRNKDEDFVIFSELGR
ncbi:MAG: carboxypeptidase-like regulatory domain-containing protein, partial [bacterium]|nr:carboxypeptidase-like regulatory domain-containing protein [bacterium]